MMFKPRPMQQQVLEYTYGKMGVSAVPGSGKTQTLSYLAAQLIMEGKIQDDQEVLIVTLVNSAVDNFAFRIADFVKKEDYYPILVIVSVHCMGLPMISCANALTWLAYPIAFRLWTKMRLRIFCDPQ